jgi:hypothetical protein
LLLCKLQPHPRPGRVEYWHLRNLSVTYRDGGEFNCHINPLTYDGG